MRKIYHVTVTTTNPSADKSGFFSSRKKAEEAVENAKKNILAAPDYYGDIKNCFFDIYETTSPIVDNKLD